MVNSLDPAVAQRAAIVLQARMASTRLPGKALADVNGRPILEHCIERLRATAMLPIVVATTERKDDDALVEAASRLGVEVVRGSDADVLSRFVLVVRRLELTALIRATADNPAVDLDAPRRTLQELIRSGADHVIERNLPHGSAVEAMTAAALLASAELASDAYDREHVTPLLRRDPRFAAREIDAPASVSCPDLRLTVDTREDLDFMRRVFAIAESEAQPPVGLAKLIAIARTLAANSHG